MKSLLISLLLLTLSGSCQNKKTQKQKIMPTKVEKFDYQPTISCPLGYPVDVYQGGLEAEDGGFESLYLGTHTGKGGWGSTGRSASSGLKTVPNRLNVIWISYAENQFYAIDCDINYKKMVEKFKEGYQASGYFFNGGGEYKLETYDYIVVGFAPGGVVVVWLSGGGKQVEIGRYQGSKTKVPANEIAKLDSHRHLLFEEDYVKETMTNTQIVPQEVQEANKNKPIPYGLWDTYRERYSWRPTVVSNQKDWSTIDTRIEMVNGEIEEQFDQTLVKNEFVKRALPKKINISWKDKTGQNYGSSLWFDEKEVSEAFAEIFKDNLTAQAELEFRISIGNMDITVWLHSNGKELPLNEKTKLELFKSRQQR
jgi:Protein of unknown function (DUF2931)